MPVDKKKAPMRPLWLGLDVNEYAGIAGLVSAILGLFVAPQAFVPLAILLAIWSVAHHQKPWGIATLVFAVAGFWLSPSLRQATGVNQFLLAHTSSYRSDFPMPVTKEEDYQIRREQAAEEMQAVIEECGQRHLEGEFQTNLDSARCSNPRILEVYRRIHYPYMDLIEAFVDKRIEWAQKLDKGELTEEQVTDQYNTTLQNLTQEAHERDQKQKR